MVSLSDYGILNINNLILVGDLNFTTSPAEIWGLKENLDLLADFFITLLKKYELIGIIPQVLEPTWTNGRSGKEGIKKRLDKFVVKTYLVQSFQWYKTWVGKNKISDH